MKVLVVDDEPLVRRSLRRAAELRHHQVEEAENGLEGLQKWREGMPDLVFIDVLMPKMSGPEVLAQARLEGFTTKVILISAYSGEFDPKDLAKADLFIAKPFDDIFEIIQRGEGLVHG